VIIARGVGEAYQKKMLRAGANKVISPYEIGARRMAALIMRPEIVEFLEALAPGGAYGLRIERIDLKTGSHLVGKRLEESNIKNLTDGAMVLGISRSDGGMKINPSGRTVLQAGDLLLSIGNDEQLQKLAELAQ
ncbi:TrkA family potassium uptake protein, partial [candidate division KSB1 bacterium]|nr:TrkA family potassium uptake protein [candidate division KSB1 bacterium]